MNDAIMLELRFFGVSVFWGVIILVIYDLIRVLRRILKHNTFFIALEDIIYWITCSILIFRMMYKQNNGIIRGFSIMAMLLGMLLYHETISEKLVTILAGMFHKLIKGISKLISFVLRPLTFITKKTGRLFSWIFSKLVMFYHFFIKALKYIWNFSKIAVSDDEKGD